MLTQRSVPGMFIQHMREQLRRSRSLRSHARCMKPSRRAIPVNCALNILSGRYSVRLLCSMADCQNLPPYMLEWLISHPSSEVRIAVSEHCGALPPDILHLLLQDDSVDVRYAMAENHNMPVEVIDNLCQDENPYVASRAARTKERIARQRQSEKAESLRQFPRRASSSDAKKSASA